MKGTKFGFINPTSDKVIISNKTYDRILNDARYVNELDPINMNNNKITNCKEGEDDNDVCTIKNLSVYYKKGNPIDMNNNKIINCNEGINENDVCTMKNLRNLPYYQSGNELNMNNQRITGVSDGIALNDAVNIKQLNNLNINIRNKENFSYKSG